MLEEKRLAFYQEKKEQIQQHAQESKKRLLQQKVKSLPKVITSYSENIKKTDSIIAARNPTRMEVKRLV